MKKEMKNLNITIISFILLWSVCGCKKFVEIDNVTDKYLASQVFNNDQSANSALNGIYYNIKSTISFITVNNSLSSDDIVNTSTSSTYDPYRTNTLLPSST